MVRLLSRAGLSIENVPGSEVGCGSRAPELDTLSPDRFEDGFVQK
jgi:hypothetical protein